MQLRSAPSRISLGGNKRLAFMLLNYRSFERASFELASSGEDRRLFCHRSNAKLHHTEFSAAGTGGTGSRGLWPSGDSSPHHLVEVARSCTTPQNQKPAHTSSTRPGLPSFVVRAFPSRKLREEQAFTVSRVAHECETAGSCQEVPVNYAIPGHTCRETKLTRFWNDLRVLKSRKHADSRTLTGHRSIMAWFFLSHSSALYAQRCFAQEYSRED